MRRSSWNERNDFEFAKVSVILPALNEAGYLDYVFDSISSLYYPKEKIEIIVVDNGSKDETVSIARKRGAIVLEAPNVKIGQLRNLGVQRGTGSVLAFVDSDCIVDPRWLKNAIPYLGDENVGAVGCHTRIPRHATWVEKTLDFHANKEGVKEVEYLPTANLIMKREVFESVGGFNPDSETGEDSDLCHKIRGRKLKLISDSRIRVIHLGYPKTLKELYKKEMWHSAELFHLLRSTKFRLEYVLGFGVPVAFAICLIITACFTIAGAIAHDIGFVLWGGVCFFIVPTMLSLYKVVTKKKLKFVFHSIVYFIVILLARISLGVKLLLVERLSHQTLIRSK
jgi:glycosyltransferase involved in cell wall biosynthesis